MADTIIRFSPDSVPIKAKDVGAGVFIFSTHDMAGGAGVADTSIEIQGYRILAHDNGDGTYALTTTVTTGAGDVTIEHEGVRLKLHPTGGTQVLDGVTNAMYALVVNPI